MASLKVIPFRSLLLNFRAFTLIHTEMITFLITFVREKKKKSKLDVIVFSSTFRVLTGSLGCFYLKVAENKK